MLRDAYTFRYRKGHSTTSVLLRMRDDIIRAIKNGELTLIVFGNFSKAFDTVEYSIVIRKLNALGLSKAALLWILSYLTSRRQFLQVDHKESSLADVYLEFHRAQILGPYSSIFERATCKIAYKMTLRSIESWAAGSNLLLTDETKTKQMVITTKQMSKVCNLDGYTPPLTLKDKTVDRVEKFKLLRT